MSNSLKNLPVFFKKGNQKFTGSIFNLIV